MLRGVTQSDCAALACHTRIVIVESIVLPRLLPVSFFFFFFYSWETIVFTKKTQLHLRTNFVRRLVSGKLLVPQSPGFVCMNAISAGCSTHVLHWDNPRTSTQRIPSEGQFTPAVCNEPPPPGRGDVDSRPPELKWPQSGRIEYPSPSCWRCLPNLEKPKMNRSLYFRGHREVSPNLFAFFLDVIKGTAAEFCSLT